VNSTLPILLSIAVVCGCSQKHAISADVQAAALVPTGVFIQCRDGYVLFVEKRNGTALENITVYKSKTNGGKATITTTIKAANGSVSPSLEDRSMTIGLEDARTVSGTNIATNSRLTLVLFQ
jgi:hypothetical protein